MAIKNWKNFLSIIGIVLFFYILIKIDIIKVLEEVRKANIYFIGIAFILVFVMLLIQTFKWYIIAIIQDIKISFNSAFKVNLISNFYGLVTPSKMGSIVRAEYLKKYTKERNIGKGLFNFTIDKILDIVSLIFIAILFSFVFKDKLAMPVGFFTGLFFAFVLITLFFMKKERSKIVLRFFYNRISNKNIKYKAKSTFDSFYEDVPKKRYLILFFFINLLGWIFIYLIYYFIGISLGIKLSFLYYLAILPIGTIISMIPISIGGIGTREAALISLFALFDIEAAKVFSMSLIDYFIVGIIPSILAFFLILKE